MAKTPTTNRPWLPWAIGCGVLALLFLLLVAAAVIGWLLIEDEGPDRQLPPSQVESVARIKLPPSTQRLQAHLEGFQDRIIHARFEIAPADLPAFESGLTCRLGAPASTPPTLPSGISADWWTPSAGHSWRSCEGDGQWFHQAVAAEVSDPTRVTVHLVVFEH